MDHQRTTWNTQFTCKLTVKLHIFQQCSNMSWNSSTEKIMNNNVLLQCPHNYCTKSCTVLASPEPSTAVFTAKSIMKNTLETGRCVSCRQIILISGIKNLAIAGSPREVQQMSSYMTSHNHPCTYVHRFTRALWYQALPLFLCNYEYLGVAWGRG